MNGNLAAFAFCGKKSSGGILSGRVKNLNRSDKARLGRAAPFNRGSLFD